MRDKLRKMDIPLLIMTLLYIVIGLTMIYSASNITAVARYGYKPYHFFVRQALFCIVALIFSLIFIIRVPTSKYRFLAFPLMAFILGSLIYLQIHGTITNNAQSWFDFKYFKLQPSEFAKPIIIIFMACFYDTLSKMKKPRLYLFFVPLLFILAIVYFVYKQPDMGSAVIIMTICFMTFLSIPDCIKRRKEIGKVLLVVAFIGGLYLFIKGDSFFTEDQKNRLFNFQNPCERYTEKTGYQVCNGFIAINNGGLFGVGLGNSTQKYLYLPEAHTDFIFPIIVEELGLVVGILIVVGYVYILYRILGIAKRANTLRGSILCYGTFWYLFCHIFINLLGILALIPLTGVPLPLLSYGGSFTVNCIILLFIVQRVSIESKSSIKF